MDDFSHMIGSNCGRQRHVSTRQCLTKTNYVRFVHVCIIIVNVIIMILIDVIVVHSRIPIIAMVMSKKTIGPTKSGRNFIINQ